MTSGFEFGVSPFYFFRHGEPHESNYGILQGSAEGRLTEAGRQRAEFAARRLAGAGVGSIYSSPLPRALSSAQVIADSIQAPVHRLPGLRNRRWGSPQLQTAPLVAGFQIPENPENIEPIGAFSSRVIEAVRSITGPAPVLVVAHSGVFRVIANYGGHPRARLTAIASAQLFLVEPASGPRGAWRVTEVRI